MELWQLGLVALMTVGVGVILAGALVDRTRRRARERELREPPLRPGIDPALRPTYVPAPDPRTTPAPETPRSADAQPDIEGQAIDARLADGESVTLDGVRVLVTPDAVESFRDIYRVVAAHDPLVVVAPAFSDEVVRALAANQSHGLRRAYAVIADEAARARTTALTGACRLTRQDLRSGWAPDDALGRASRWSSDTTRSHVRGE